jgi:hypothetical protein
MGIHYLFFILWHSIPSIIDQINFEWLFLHENILLNIVERQQFIGFISILELYLSIICAEGRRDFLMPCFFLFF